MFRRNIITELERWYSKINRKPLILRGARQVGKTTLVNIFSKKFENYLYLNLEKTNELRLFEKQTSVPDLLESIFYLKNKRKKPGKILIFIDEIQNSSQAVAFLRYFYEEAPELFVISAGSLLESLIDKTISFPVGRVEYLKLHPVSFVEFLDAMGEQQSIDLLQKKQFPEYGHEKLLSLFHKYILIGGMPEIVQNYSINKNLFALNKIYESLIISYLDDVEKYARNNTLTHIIRHVITNSFSNAGKRIKFQHFGNSNYRSREVGEAFKALEKTMLLQLIYPVTNTELPANVNYKKSPRLQILDTGLLNYSANIQQAVFGAKQLSGVHEGIVTEHIVGQELLSLNSSPLYRLNFWTREKKNSNSEIDFIYQYKNFIIPIEVKTGKTGRLRSLHQFMDNCSHKYAVRIYSGKYEIQKTKTIAGKEYFLLNLPFFLISKLDNYLELMISEN